VFDEVREATEPIRVSLEAKEKELIPLRKDVNRAQQAIDVTQASIDTCTLTLHPFPFLFNAISMIITDCVDELVGDRQRAAEEELKVAKANITTGTDEVKQKQADLNKAQSELKSASKQLLKLQVELKDTIGTEEDSTKERTRLFALVEEAKASFNSAKG
jgi:peptidoglycan hydrolase CwlO-like protein